MVPIHNVHREVEQVDKIMEKIIQVRTVDTEVIEVERRVDNVIIEERIKEVERIVPYMQDRIVEIQTYRDKIVPVERVIQEIREVQQIVEKVVDRISEVPRVYEVEKLVEKRVDVPKII
jgi:transcriptional/translational regulatory protein YebC/TACO1